jgi:hypothetical protein
MTYVPMETSITKKTFIGILSTNTEFAILVTQTMHYYQMATKKSTLFHIQHVIDEEHIHVRKFEYLFKRNFIEQEIAYITP